MPADSTRWRPPLTAGEGACVPRESQPSNCIVPGELLELVSATSAEVFGVPAPDLSEVRCEWDYDCEVCCAPMPVVFSAEDGEVTAEARGLGQ
jgi:hypothetical protein